MPAETDDVSAGHLENNQRSSRRAFLAGATGSVAAGFAGVDTCQSAETARRGEDVNPRLFTFVGGNTGSWSVVDAKVIVGDPLPAIEKLEIIHGSVAAKPDGCKWVLRGVTSNERYVIRAEKEQLIKKQASLGRPEAAHAALIPIRKNAKWWALTQDERRAIFEEKSGHVKAGLKYLPAIARRLHHCRDLEQSEQFDFLTLFDFAKADVAAFNELLAELRKTEEWKYVDREVDIRLIHSDK